MMPFSYIGDIILCLFITDCLYGDKVLGCKKQYCDYVYSNGKRYDTNCCGTCGLAIATTGRPTTPTPTPVTQRPTTAVVTQAPTPGRVTTQLRTVALPEHSMLSVAEDNALIPLLGNKFHTLRTQQAVCSFERLCLICISEILFIVNNYCKIKSLNQM